MASTVRRADEYDEYGYQFLDPRAHPNGHYSHEAPTIVITENRQTADHIIARSADVQRQVADTASAEAWAGELSALESRADTDSLEDLQQRRRALIDRHGRLLALHGSFGLFDDRRKQFLEAQKVVARRALAESGAKVTEGMVESEAYGSTEYQRLLDNALNDKIEYLRVQTELSEIDEKIKNRETALYVYGQELKLAR